VCCLPTDLLSSQLAYSDANVKVSSAAGVRFYKIDGTGVTNVSPTINSIIQGIDGQGATIEFTAGKYMLDQPVVLYDKSLITIQGSGSGMRSAADKCW
jgi:hypothetical protein